MIAVDPANSLAHPMLGDVLGELGGSTKQLPLLRKATDLDPDRVGAWHNLAMLTKVSDADRSLVERIEELLRGPAAPTSTAARCISRSARPMTILASTRGRSSISIRQTRSEAFAAPFDRDALPRRIDRLIDASPRSVRRRHARWDASDLPVLIVGMPGRAPRWSTGRLRASGSRRPAAS